MLKYINETRTEMRHVAWPTHKQTIIFTTLVIVISLATATYLGLFDFLFTRSLQASLQVVDSSTPVQPQHENSGVTVDGADIESELLEGVEFSIEPVDSGADNGSDASL